MEDGWTLSGSPQQWGEPGLWSQDGSLSGTWQDVGRWGGRVQALESDLRLVLPALAPGGGVFLGAGESHPGQRPL